MRKVKKLFVRSLHVKNFLQVVMLLLVLWLGNVAGVMASTQDVIVEGRQYRIDTESLEATLTGGSFKGEEYIPETIKVNDVTYTVNKLWYSCCANSTELTSVHIPKTITVIFGECFKGCTKLETVYGLENTGINSLGDAAFEGCQSLKNIKFPESMFVMHKNCFKDCKSLQSITYPGDFRYFSSDCFQGCDNLTTIMIQEHSKGYQKWIYPNAFTGCVNLKEMIVLDKEPVQYYQSYNKTLTDYVSGSLKIFYVTEGKEDRYKHLPIWKERPIEGYMAVRQDTVTIDGFNYKLNPKTKVATLFHGDYHGNVVIPSKVTYGGEEFVVGGMVDFCFYGCNVWSVKLPSTITKIPYDCFGECSGLSSIDIPTSVTEFDEMAFDRCYAFKTFTIPAHVTKVGPYCFNFGHFESLEILSPLTELPHMMCWSCTRLKNITLPNTVEKIGESCFYYCSSLEEITLPSSVKEIGRNAFANCKKLKRINFSKVRSLPGFLFEKCNELAEVVIPETVEIINPNCFKNNTSIKQLYSLATVPPTFSNEEMTRAEASSSVLPAKLEVLYVPQASIEAYKVADGWSEAPEIRAIETTEINTVRGDLNKKFDLTYENGSVVAKGLHDGSVVWAYDLSGCEIGKAVVINSMAKIPVAKGKIIIIKVGDKQIKVVL